MVTKILDRISAKKSNDDKRDENNNFGERDRPTLFGEDGYQKEIVWRNALIFLYLHCAAIYGFTLPKRTMSVVIGWIVGFITSFGTTIGV